MIYLCALGGREASGQVVIGRPDNFYVRMAGQVVSRQTGRPVGYVTVINRQSRRMTTADSLGSFSITLRSGDTIELRRVGFETLYYMKPPERNGNYLEYFYLNEVSMTLREVTVYRGRSVNSIALNPEYGQVDRFNLQIGPRKTRPVEAEISSPFSYLYEQYSRTGRNRRKLAALREERDREFFISARYNKLYVHSLTGLEGDDLEAFMAYCPMSLTFILGASDYDLAAATLNCYRQFMNDL